MSTLDGCFWICASYCLYCVTFWRTHAGAAAASRRKSTWIGMLISQTSGRTISQARETWSLPEKKAAIWSGSLNGIAVSYSLMIVLSTLNVGSLSSGHLDRPSATAVDIHISVLAKNAVGWSGVVWLTWVVGFRGRQVEFPQLMW